MASAMIHKENTIVKNDGNLIKLDKNNLRELVYND